MTAGSAAHPPYPAQPTAPPGAGGGGRLLLSPDGRGGEGVAGRGKRPGPGKAQPAPSPAAKDRPCSLPAASRPASSGAVGGKERAGGRGLPAAVLRTQ